MPNAEIKHFNVLIDGKSFFDLPGKNEEEAYEKIIEMSRNDVYSTGNLLDFLGRLERQNNIGATVFFFIEKSGESTFEFLQNSVNVL